MSRITVLLVLVALSGCATVTRGTTEAFVIETDPAGADAVLSSGHQCKTPCSLELKRKKEFVVKIQKEGFEPVEANVSSQVAGAGAAGMAGNLLLGGVVGAAVDVGTGATKELKPNPLTVRLVPLHESNGTASIQASSVAARISFAEGTGPEYFYPPSPESPNGTVLMADPPPSVRNKGIRKVSVTAVDGKLMPPETDRIFRLAPGVYRITFSQPDKPDTEKSVELEIEQGLRYSVGWRPLGEDWEPVVYDVST